MTGSGVKTAKEMGMRNIWIVIKHEIKSVISKRSFWIMTFLFPLLIVGLNAGVQVLSVRAVEKAGRRAGRCVPGDRVRRSRWGDCRDAGPGS